MQLPRLKVRLTYLNIGLFVAIIVINAFTILTPFLPGMFDRPAPPHSAVASAFAQKVLAQKSPEQAKANQLIIPSIQLDQPIYGGTDTYAGLAKGVWRWPDGSTPDRGSNTVLLGHRFTYTNPRGVFYFLDKVQVGDEIDLVWNNTTYTYQVAETKVVPPTAGDILNATPQPTLTIYTCTPLWRPVNRLVVIAHLEKQS